MTWREQRAADPLEQRGSRPQSRWWFVAAATLVAIFGLLNTRWADQRLDASENSDVRAVLAGLSAVSVLALGLQLVIVGILRDPLDREIRRPPTMRVTAHCAIACAVATAIATFAAIQSTVPFRVEVAAAAAIAVGCIVLTVPARSVLLGTEHWRDLSAIAIFSALPRIIVTASGLTVGVLALLAAVVGGEVLAAALALVATSKTARVTRWPAGTVRHIWNGLGASAGLAVVLLLASVSLRERLGADADAFNQSASLARLPFLLVFAVAFVFFPGINRAPIGSPELRRTFHRAMVFCTATAAVSISAVVAAPTLAMRLLTSDPTQSASTVRALSIAFGLIGVASVSLMQYVAHGSRFALWAWPAAAVMLVGQVVCSSAASLSACALLASLVLLLSASLPALLRVLPVLTPPVVDRSRHRNEPLRNGATVVIPSYNPGPMVLTTIDEVTKAFRDAGLDVVVVVVSDGSTDGTAELIEQSTRSNVLHVRHHANRGKGAALRTGFQVARTPVVGFVDADGDLAPAQLVDLVRIQQETGASIVFGSKRHAESSVEISRARLAASRMYQWLIRSLFQLNIRDTQTGIKVFRQDALAGILPVLKEEGFALDLEMFVAARYIGHTDFVEVPVRLSRHGTTTMSSKSAVRMIGHTLKIFWRAKVTLEYLRATTSATVD